jgi:hypothetical protein
MTTRRTIKIPVFVLGSLLVPIAAQGQDSSSFYFWFQRDGACIACAKMPPPGTSEVFSQTAGIDVVLNGYNQTTGQHWENKGVGGYQVTYTYKIDGATHSATQTASGDAASIVIKPYAAGDVNKAQVISISVTASYSSGSITRTVDLPEAFKVY